MHPRLKKIPKRSAIVMGGVVIGIPLLLVAINVVDQDLKAEVIAFADLSDNDVPEEGNGYFAWVDLTAPMYRSSSSAPGLSCATRTPASPCSGTTRAALSTFNGMSEKSDEELLGKRIELRL